MISIRSIREEVTDRFAVLTFVVNTDGMPYFEVALASDPSLFHEARRKERTGSTFYASRAAGRLAAQRGQAVYMVPPAALKRLAGNDRLFYALATFADPAESRPSSLIVPNGNSHWIGLTSFSGGRMRRMPLMGAGRFSAGEPGYSPAADLTWAGDAMGTAAPERTSAGGAPSTVLPESSQPVQNPPAGEQAAAFSYDDGLGPWPLAEDHDNSQEARQDLGSIDGPIPDEAEARPPALAQEAPAATQPEYPRAARFAAADPANYRQSRQNRQIDRIVIHITDGGPNINGPISWFRNPQARVSAHYIVGRDGEIVQMVRHNDVAWHAGRANGGSIGIEHVANTRGLNPTEAQYAASAALVRWLCDTCTIPVDRDHIQGHCEADPNTSHRGCPNAVWDWNQFMGLVQNAAGVPRDAAQAVGLGSGRAMQSATTRPWSDFFHFPAGTSFRVDGPLNYNGTGRVNELTDQRLGFSLNLPEYDIAGRHIPAANVSVAVAYAGEGPGNSGSIVHNGSTYSDSNISIATERNQRRIRPSITVPGMNLGDIVVKRDGRDEIDLDISIDGTSYDFDLERTGAASQSQAVALAMIDITHAGSYRLAYDRLSHYGVIEPSPARDRRVFHGDTTLQQALNDWAPHLTRAVDAPPQYILTGGLTGDGHGAHGQGLAIDIDGLWWADNNVFLANQAPSDWARYLRIEASLRKVFGVVLNHDYNADHHDHWHCDLTNNTSWRRAESQAKFAQRVLKEIWQKNIGVDGDWGRESRHAAQEAGYDFSRAGEWDRFLEDTITQQCSQAPAAASGQAAARGLNAEVVGAIAGAVITRILDNEGDISWSLDQLNGLKHPFNDAKNQGTGAFQTGKVKVPGPRMTQGFGLDAIYANADLTFQYNGRSLGNVQIAITDNDDALGAGLEVKAQIADDANTYRKGNSDPFAALRVRFQYRFTNPILNDVIKFTDFVLYGDGTYEVRYRWDVDPISGRPRYQSLQSAYA